jgi:hypothetical protein
VASKPNVRGTKASLTTFGFDARGRPLAWREAVKVLALVKRLQCREMASNPATATEAGSVLAALQAAVVDRGEDSHLRADPARSPRRQKPRQRIRTCGRRPARGSIASATTRR